MSQVNEAETLNGQVERIRKGAWRTNGSRSGGRTGQAAVSGAHGEARHLRENLQLLTPMRPQSVRIREIRGHLRRLPAGIFRSVFSFQNNSTKQTVSARFCNVNLGTDPASTFILRVQPSFAWRTMMNPFIICVRRRASSLEPPVSARHYSINPPQNLAHLKRRIARSSGKAGMTRLCHFIF